MPWVIGLKDEGKPIHRLMRRYTPVTEKGPRRGMKDMSLRLRMRMG